MDGVTQGVASGLASSAGSAFESVLGAIFFGSFNPKYKKEDKRRMRYIQSKYSQAYGDGKKLQLKFYQLGSSILWLLELENECF